MAFSPDGKLLASASDDFTLKLWRVADATLLRTLRGHEEDVQSVVFSPGGALLYSGGKDNTIRVWRIPEGTLLRTVSEGAVGWPYQEPRHALALSPKGEWVATGRTFSDRARTRQLGVVQVRGSSELNLLHEFFLTNAEVRSLAFSPDRRWLAAGTQSEAGGNLVLWQSADVGEWRRVTPTPIAAALSGLESVAFSPLGDRLAASTESALIGIWRTADWAMDRMLTNGFARQIAFSPDGGALATAGSDLTLWDVATGSAHWTQEGRDSFRAVAFSPDGDWLATGTKDDQVAVWPSADGQNPRVLTAHAEPVSSLLFSPDARKLASWAGAPDDNTLKLWDVRDGALLWSIANAPSGYVLAFSPDSRTVLVADGRFLNADNGSLRPSRVSGPVTSAAFSPAGDMLALGTGDWHIELWQLSNGTLIHRLTNYFGPAGMLAFSPDGQYLGSAGERFAPSSFRSTKFWRVSDGAFVANVAADTFAWSDSGSRLVFVNWGPPDELAFYRWADFPSFLHAPGLLTVSKFVGVSPDSAYAVSSRQNAMIFQRLEDEAVVQRYDEEVSDVTAFAFSTDGRWMAYGREDASVLVARSPLDWLPNTTQPPTIITQPRSISVDEGQEAVLWVKARGTEPLSYEWRFNGGAVAGATNFVLARWPAEPAHGGVYSVTVRNSLGTVTSEQVTLSVKTPPRITSQPESQTVLFGSMVSFNVSATSAEPVRYRWRFNGDDLPNATNATLTLSSVGPKDSGNYSVLVVGSTGDSTSSMPARLVVQVPLWRLWSTPYTVESAGFTPDGSAVAATSPMWLAAQHGAQRTGTQVGRWSTVDGTSLGFRALGGGPYPLHVSADGALATKLTENSAFQLWRVTENTLVRTLLTQASPIAQAFSLNGRLLAGASRTNLTVWRTSDGTVLQSISASNSSPTTLAFSPDGSLLALGSGLDSVRVWRTQTAELSVALSQPVYGRTSLAFSPDNVLLATGGDDRLIRLWRLSDGALVRTMTGGFTSISAIEFSRDGALLAVIKAGQLELWRTDDGVLLSISGPAVQSTSVAFSPTANLLLLGSWELALIDYSVALRGSPPRLRIDASSRPWTISIDTQPGRSHSVLVSTNLMSWTELTNFVSSSVTHRIYDLGPSYPQCFYRALSK